MQFIKFNIQSLKSSEITLLIGVNNQCSAPTGAKPVTAITYICKKEMNFYDDLLAVDEPLLWFTPCGSGAMSGTAAGFEIFQKLGCGGEGGIP